jgi:hypothetical protein
MIPKEIDDLMWAIAEGTDQSAIEAFGDRYPNLREELLKRIRTVKALKSGNRLPKTTPVPTFKNTQVQPTNWRLVWGTFAFALIAMFSFAIYKINSPSPQVPVVSPINVEPAKIPDANIVVQPDTNTGPLPITPPGYNNRQEPNLPNLPPPTVDESNNSSAIIGGVKNLKLESAPLQSAIYLIAEAGHFSVTIGPGMPNPTVKVDFEGMEPLDMLKELGQQYAFTAIVDGQRSILIIPKKDEDEGQISSDNR